MCKTALLAFWNWDLIEMNTNMSAALNHLNLVVVYYGKYEF